MTRFLDIFGTQLTATFAGIAGLYLLWSTLPLWWPLLRVLRRRGTLPRPGWFVFIATMLAYGATGLTLTGVSAVMVLPPLMALDPYPPVVATLAPGTWLITRASAWLFPFMGLSHVLLVWWINRRLATHWKMLCERGAVHKEAHDADA